MSKLTSRVAMVLSIACCSASLSVCLIQSSSAATQIYKYTDDSGVQTFTTDVGSIPEKYQGKAVLLFLENSPAPPVVPAAQVGHRDGTGSAQGGSRR